MNADNLSINENEETTWTFNIEWNGEEKNLIFNLQMEIEKEKKI